MGNEKTKNYPLYAILICFCMILLMVITPFLPLFQVEVFGAKTFEKGVDFLTPATSESIELQVGEGKYSEYKQKVSYKSEFIGDLGNYELWRGVIYICQIAIFIVAFATLMTSLGSFSSYNKKNFEKVVKDIKLNVWILLAVCFVNYATVLYLLSEINKNIVLVKITSAVHFTSIPIIVLAIVALILCKTYKAVPILEEVANNHPSISRGDSIELIAKYKELLDNGIITEEEYNERKKELL